ncbi:acyl-carrier phosphodiesterase-like protein [Xanthomonas campestris pv. campestris str. ATCC 33913]|uniref:Acyl-carrier phosphodiesterase-like protein n=2 Tax=Xanthomonas campestris TaxID=339 RepID=Q8PEE2_XANCP|nr:acyl-carrier phosphodiesterase-like protein [Xanthomonas campestris pv. campestris str. ATCC 33913]
MTHRQTTAATPSGVAAPRASLSITSIRDITMKLLHLDSSILGDYSASRQLTASIVAKLQAADPALQYTYRDLAANPIGHLSGAHLAAAQNPPATRRRSWPTTWR